MGSAEAQSARAAAASAGVNPELAAENAELAAAAEVHKAIERAGCIRRLALPAGTQFREPRSYS
jgi:hypothetical protein